MLKTHPCPIPSNLPTVAAMALVLGLCAVTVTAQPPDGEPCGDAERQQFAAAAEAGMSPENLEAMFGHCRGILPVPSFLPNKSAAVVDNTIGSIRYERLNSCGYHPQAKVASCDVEVRLPSFYGTIPQGTNEYVKFCLDCNRDGVWDYSTMGAVHVNDDTSGTQASWYFNAFATIWPDPGTFAGHNNIYPPFNPQLPWSCIQNDDLGMQVRAVLSWAVPPAGTCANPSVIWGNMVTFDTRRDH